MSQKVTRSIFILGCLTKLLSFFLLVISKSDIIFDVNGHYPEILRFRSGILICTELQLYCNFSVAPVSLYSLAHSFDILD